MTFSDQYLDRLSQISAKVAAAEGFPANYVLAFELYDGIEEGVAALPSGAILRIKAISQSRSTRFRAFLVDAISQAKLGTLLLTNVPRERKIITDLQDRDLMTRIKSEVTEATAFKTYIGIGTAWMDWLVVRPLEGASMEGLIFEEGENFRQVHKLLAGAFRSAC